MTGRARREVVDMMEEFRTTSAQLRDRLRKVERGTAKMLRRIESAEPIVEVFEKEDLAGLRAQLVDDLERLETTKRRMRLACFRLAMIEEASCVELGRAWGFSRQLASRTMKEASAAQVTLEVLKTVSVG